MKSCIDIFNEFKGRSAFVGSKYIDPFGYEYPNSVVECRDCIFNFGGDASGNDTCLLYKEMGSSEQEINRKHMIVFNERKCQYFLTRDFSEGGDEDEEAKREVKKIADRLNYPIRKSNSTSTSNSSDGDDFNPLWFVLGLILLFLLFKGCS